ncbi:uroporphyrin-III C-methyltransferase [Staphylococcus caledonicus]|uniref:uroporphyrinogen-III C-methyltransferase n=1 Tax=Staphylococcus caledonicus TaxID=2741333 RepID=UPI003C30228E
MSIDSGNKVYLIGAGPGNPNLLTKKAERLIRKADVILYDRLVNPLILQYAPATTEVIDVGKKPYVKHIQQDDINLKIVEAAQKHQTVVRLKGGDPAIFGRVTEEVNTLKQYNISYEIVPGVTSASAAVATMDLGLTMRAVAPSVTFSTGHFKNSSNHDTDIRNLLNGGTLAIYMGVKRLGNIIQQISQFTDEDYSIAVVFNATCYNQKVVTGKLSNIEHQLQLQLDGEPGICILGAIIDYIDVEHIVDSNYSFDDTLYIIKGSKEDVLIEAEIRSDRGQRCLVDYGAQYHSSQEQVYQHIIETNNIKYIEV